MLASSTIAKSWKITSVCQGMNGQAKGDSYTQGEIMKPEKERAIYTCRNLEDTMPT
jgi:hypothetical protein